MKVQYRIALEVLILVMILLALHICNRKLPTQHKADIAIADAKLNEQIAHNNYNNQLNKVKVVERLIPIYKDRWKTKYDTIYKEAPDTCHYYLAKLNAEKMASDSVNELVIKTYSDVVMAGIIYQAKKDSVILKQDSVIDSLNRSKKKFWKGFKVGFISGVIVAESANIGTKFIK